MNLADRATIADRLGVLPPHAVQLEGYLERYIRLSIAKWSKGVVPYEALAAFFHTGRPTVTRDGREVELFATGEMWGKAVRSTALFYRYTGDPELKAILKKTVADLLSTRRANGTISCAPIERQSDGPMGDLWERKYVLSGLDGYYDSVESEPAVLQAMIDQADATIAQVGPPPKARIVDLGWSTNLIGGNNIESSTILEPILRLYKAHGARTVSRVCPATSSRPKGARAGPQHHRRDSGWPRSERYRRRLSKGLRDALARRGARGVLPDHRERPVASGESAALSQGDREGDHAHRQWRRRSTLPPEGDGRGLG